MRRNAWRPEYREWQGSAGTGVRSLSFAASIPFLSPEGCELVTRKVQEVQDEKRITKEHFENRGIEVCMSGAERARATWDVTLARSARLFTDFSEVSRTTLRLCRPGLRGFLNKVGSYLPSPQSTRLRTVIIQAAGRLSIASRHTAHTAHSPQSSREVLRVGSHIALFSNQRASDTC